jgi:hypothetical protein
MDEHRIGLKPIVRGVWAPVGERPIASAIIVSSGSTSRASSSRQVAAETAARSASRPPIAMRTHSGHGLFPKSPDSHKSLISWRAGQNKTANTYVIEIPL